jgi:uncharacterized protein (DUF2141 family)
VIQRILAPALVLAWAVAVAPRASCDEPPPSDPVVGTLRVVPVGLETDRGAVMILLARSEAEFESDAEAFRNAVVKVENRQAMAVFEDVPYGAYAIKVFHDENDNRELDTNFVGFPKEKFGFSNNAMGRMGPPSYEQARFAFEAEQAKIEIEMR